MKLFFLGSSGFAVPSLLTVVELGYRPIVVTKPDKPAKRGQKISGTKLKNEAVRLGLPTLQPNSLKDPDVIELFRNEMPDLIISIAYGAYIPAEILAVPREGTINLHPSLLPKYRGAAPVERAVMAGETATGVTLAYVTEEWDAGDIIAQEKTPIEPDDDAGALLGKLADQGAKLLKKSLPMILDGTVKAIPQDHSKATFAPRIRDEETRIDWSRPAYELVNQIRGLAPHRSSETRFRGKALKLYKGKEVAKNGVPGMIIEVTPEGPVIAAGKNAVLLLSLKPENKNTMTGRDFVNGYAVKKNERF